MARLRLLACSSLLLAACSSSSGGGPAPRRPQQEEEREREVPRAEPELPAGHVRFELRDVDLKDDVLPLFAKQAGVVVRWEGPAKRIRALRFTQPTPWRDAMDLVCQFTRTNLTQDEQGRWELRPGYHGTVSAPKAGAAEQPADRR